MIISFLNILYIFLYFPSTHEKTHEEKKPTDKEDHQPVKSIQAKLPPLYAKGGDILPRKKKGGLVKIKPAEEKLKNTILKKEQRKIKLG